MGTSLWSFSREIIFINTLRMKKRLLLTLAAWALLLLDIMAVPAMGVTKTARLADGSTIELTLCGDEHYSFYTDKNGLCYSLRADGVAMPMSRKLVTETWTSKKQQRLKHSRSLQSVSQEAQRRAGVPSAATTGKHRGLVILMEFQDVKFSTQNANAVYQDFFNKEGYSDYGMTGSVRDYFLSQSYNQLEIDFDVVGPYTTKYNMDYYGAPRYNDNGELESNDSNPYGMIAEGVDAASKDVDYSVYDWDNDGEVDQVFVIYAGYAQAQGGDKNTIWPHEWSLSVGGLTKKYNGVTIDTYGCSSELRGASGTSLDGIGSACHEFSHCLGLPDMYDTSSSGTYGMSDWDVMCSGNYNNSSRTPAGYTSYERWFSGWMTPTEINSMTRVNDMKPLATTPEAYILYNNGNRNEYYLLENRQPVGYDAGLNGHGLLIVHVNYNLQSWTSNTVNANPSRPGVTVIPADNNYSASARGIAGDAWPGTSGNTTLTNFTTPAAEVFNANSDGTMFMSKNIDNITENTTTRTISFVACRPDLAVPSPDGGTEQNDGRSFKVTWPAVNGAIGYELELTAIGSAAANPDDALLLNIPFDKFLSSTTGFSDVSSKLGTYGFPGWTGSKLYTSPKYMKFGTTSATGFLQSPWYGAPSSQEVTFVVGTEEYAEDTPVDVTLTFETGENGGSMADVIKEEQTFTVTGKKKDVFSFSIPKQHNLFRIRIAPKKMAYMYYLSVYEGTWTAEQLDINTQANSPKRRADVIGIFSTTSNSYTFTDLNSQNRYIYCVRSKGEENIFSQWSEEKMFTFGSTGIDDIIPDLNDSSSPVRYYDLQGREVDASTRGLVIMKQGNSVKKVVR